MTSAPFGASGRFGGFGGFGIEARRG